MTTRKYLVIALISTWLLTGCSETGSNLADGGDQGAAQPAASGDVDRFNGVWEVTGRTGNEEGTNEPVCGHETGLGTVRIENSKITGNIKNKSGFEYTVEGTIESTGRIKAMLIYSGYDAAELFGTFSAETNSAKGSWKDAVNACPGVWTAIRVDGAPTAESGEPDGVREIRSGKALPAVTKTDS
jgi:hypothetical protein